MERVYYSINEDGAKTANDMMSFSDYKAGSKTNEYHRYVDKAYELAASVAEKKPDQEERIFSMAARYSKRMAEYMNNEIRIGMICPSIMICGGGNFPVKKKERQNKAWEKNHQLYKDTQGILTKMENILNGKEVIRSGDENAIEKLEEKLKGLKDTQETMKATNKAIRLKDVTKGNILMKDMGYTDAQIEKLRSPDFCGRIGYPDYALQNNNANIHRVEGRLKDLKSEKEKGTSEIENQFFKVVENTESMRLQLLFAGKPEPEVREILKSNGFRWAPSQSAWQRQLTSNAKYALNRVIEQMKKRQEG